MGEFRDTSPLIDMTKVSFLNTIDPLHRAACRGEEVDLADLRGRESGPWSAPLAEPVSWWWRQYKEMMAELQLKLPPVILAA